MTVPTYISNAGIGAQQELVTSTPTSNVIDISQDPYNADLTGGTNERSTLQQALNDATSGDTVYIPSGTLMLDHSGVNSQSVIDITTSQSGVTIKGDGHDTVIKLADGHDTYNKHVIDVSGSDQPSNFTIRDLKVDTTGSGTSNNFIRGIWFYESGSATGNLVENVWVTGPNGTHIRPNGPGITVRYCSVYDGGGHGFANDDQGVYSSQNDRIHYEYCHAYGCGKHGLDASGGYTTVRHYLGEQNGYSGCKNTGATHDCEWVDCLLRDNDDLGYLISSAPNGDIHMTDVSAQNNPLGGFNFQGGTSYTLYLDQVQAIGNCSGTNNGNIFIHETWDVDAGTIESADAVQGVGLHLQTGVTGSITTYNHYNNAGGALDDGGSSLTIGTQNQDSNITAKTAPTNDTSGGGDSGGDGSTTTISGIFEDFDNGLTKYVSGNTAEFGIDTADARNGSNSLYYASNGWQHLLTDTTQSPAPQRGTPFGWSQKFDADGGEGVFVFFAQGTTWVPDSYCVRVALGSGTDASTLTLQKHSGGSWADLASTPFTHTTSEWTDFEVDPQDPTISVTVTTESGTQLATVSADDAVSNGGFESGGYGVEWNDRAADTSQPRWDAFYIEGSGSSYVNVGGTTTQHTMYVNEGGTATPYNVNIGSTQ